MTTLNAAREAVYARFVANFAGTANLVFDNEEPGFDVDAVTAWVRLSVRGIVRSQDTLGAAGNRKFRATASAFVQVYTKSDTGVQQSDALAKEAADIFDAVGFGGLDFNAAQFKETGPDGKWYQQVVECPFDYDEIK
jgi:hypothetical protein